LHVQLSAYSRLTKMNGLLCTYRRAVKKLLTQVSTTVVNISSSTGPLLTTIVLVLSLSMILKFNQKLQ